ncbi:SUGP1 protein, partial [Daphoenositta chrysoptera]|nr:SUGP1 protein [Daphoenositta chrysoptera]
VQDLKGLGYEKGKPVGLVGVTELSEAQKKQLKEQQEMQQMYDMIMRHKRAMQEMQLLWERAVQQHQHGYDSDEEVDSELGTWEHRLRRMEMDKTRGKPRGSGSGVREHLRASRDSWGRERGPGAPRGFPGREGGPGASGARSRGVPGKGGGSGSASGAPFPWDSREGASQGPCPAAPRGILLGRGTTAVDGAGFGIERPAELTKEDDEYEAFRKRMMLAYRFRPNPL